MTERRVGDEIGLGVGIAICGALWAMGETIGAGFKIYRGIRTWAGSDRQRYEKRGPGEFSVKPIVTPRRRVFEDGEEIQPLNYPLRQTIARVLDRD